MENRRNDNSNNWRISSSCLWLRRNNIHSTSLDSDVSPQVRKFVENQAKIVGFTSKKPLLVKQTQTVQSNFAAMETPDSNFILLSHHDNLDQSLNLNSFFFGFFNALWGNPFRIYKCSQDYKTINFLTYREYLIESAGTIHHGSSMLY